MTKTVCLTMSSSRLSPDMIGRIASSLGLEEKMGHETAQALATEVEVRLRLLIQDAKKFADHANRTAITPEDINQAVILHGDNKLIGFASERQMHIAAQFHRSAQSAQLRGRAGGGDKQSSADPDIYFYRDQTLGIEQAAEAARQAKRPCAPELLCHFLAIHGSQPAIAENPDQHPNADILPFVKPVTISSTTDAAKNVRIDKIVEHELSSEQISYFKTVVKDVLSSSRSSLRMVYASLSADFGLQNMLPYFIRFMSDQHLHIFKNEPRPLWSLPRLRALLCMTQCMLSNRSINVEAYLHQLNPMILTVLVNRLLTSSVAEDHWALRDYAANLAAKICDIYDSKYPGPYAYALAAFWCCALPLHACAQNARKGRRVEFFFFFVFSSALTNIQRGDTILVLLLPRNKWFGDETWASSFTFFFLFCFSFFSVSPARHAHQDGEDAVSNPSRSNLALHQSIRRDRGAGRSWTQRHRTSAGSDCACLLASRICTSAKVWRGTPYYSPRLLQQQKQCKRSRRCCGQHAATESHASGGGSKVCLSTSGCTWGAAAKAPR